MCHRQNPHLQHPPTTCYTPMKVKQNDSAPCPPVVQLNFTCGPCLLGDSAPKSIGPGSMLSLLPPGAVWPGGEPQNLSSAAACATCQLLKSNGLRRKKPCPSTLLRQNRTTPEGRLLGLFLTVPDMRGKA